MYEFETSLDMTRYQALRKRQAELEILYNQSLEMLEQLRDRPRSEALAIFEQIRRGDTLEELSKSIRNGDLLMVLANKHSPPSSGNSSNPSRDASISLPPLRMAIPDMPAKVLGMGQNTRQEQSQDANLS